MVTEKEVMACPGSSPGPCSVTVPCFIPVIRRLSPSGYLTGLLNGSVFAFTVGCGSFPSRITGGIVSGANGSGGLDVFTFRLLSDFAEEGTEERADDVRGDGLGEAELAFVLGVPTLIVAVGRTVGVVVAEWSAAVFAVGDGSHADVAASIPMVAVRTRMRRPPTTLLLTTSSCIGVRGTVGHCGISVRSIARMWPAATLR